MDIGQLRDHVVRPTLQFLDLHSESAEALLLGTAAQESNLGRYVHQVGGPALSIYQIEPRTHHSLWDHYLAYHPDRASLVRDLASKRFFLLDRARMDAELTGNLFYATAIARVAYLIKPEPLPAVSDYGAMADYWKRHYNTPKGRGTPRQFAKKYKRHVRGLYA